MLGDGRERPALGLAFGCLLTGTVILAAIGGLVVVLSVWGWAT